MSETTPLQALVTVTMTPLELKLFRRALAKAADQNLLDRTEALRRICALDVLRWEAEEGAEKPPVSAALPPASQPVSKIAVRRVPRAA